MCRLVICHAVDSKYLTSYAWFMLLFEELPTYVSDLHKCFFLCCLIFFVLLQQKYLNQ